MRPIDPLKNACIVPCCRSKGDWSATGQTGFAFDSLGQLNKVQNLLLALQGEALLLNPAHLVQVFRLFRVSLMDRVGQALDVVCHLNRDAHPLLTLNHDLVTVDAEERLCRLMCLALEQFDFAGFPAETVLLDSHIDVRCGIVRLHISSGFTSCHWFKSSRRCPGL